MNLQKELKKECGIHKKQVVLTGTILLPLRPGGIAWIGCNGNTYTTSKVKRILEVSPASVMFETLHTIYRIQYALIPARRGSIPRFILWQGKKIPHKKLPFGK